MAHIQQLYDNMNQHFRKIYKEGVWIDSYVTKIGRNSKGNIFFECIDRKKFDQGKPSASAVLRLIDPSHTSFKVLVERLNISFDDINVHNFIEGDVKVSFKVLPNMHFEKGMMPLIKDIAVYDINIQLENLKVGIRIGVDNTQMQKPANTGKLWSDEDNKMLRVYLSNHSLSIESIGLMLKRTPMGCVEQAESLGLLDRRRLSKMRKEAKDVTARLAL